VKKIQKKIPKKKRLIRKMKFKSRKKYNLKDSNEEKDLSMGSKNKYLLTMWI